MSDVITYMRGQIWMMKDYVEDKFHQKGSVQRGSRPVLIYSSDHGNITNDTVMVFKITSNSEKSKYSVNVKYEDENGKTSVILTNQVQTVDKSDLIRYLYTLSDDTMTKVMKAHEIATLGNISDSAKDIDSKIDEIYKIMADLKVIKMENMHDTSKDEKMIKEVAKELGKIYVDMSKYHDATISQIKDDMDPLSIYNAKCRMGLTNSNASDSSMADNVSQTAAVNDKPLHSSGRRNRKQPKKPSGYWTNERIKQFIADKDILTFDEYMKKYEYTDRKAIMKAYYTYSSKLNRMKK